MDIVQGTSYVNSHRRSGSKRFLPLIVKGLYPALYWKKGTQGFIKRCKSVGVERTIFFDENGMLFPTELKECQLGRYVID